MTKKKKKKKKGKQKEIKVDINKSRVVNRLKSGQGFGEVAL